jgi:hypothetical protein
MRYTEPRSQNRGTEPSASAVATDFGLNAARNVSRSEVNSKSFQNGEQHAHQNQRNAQTHDHQSRARGRHAPSTGILRPYRPSRSGMAPTRAVSPTAPDVPDSVRTPDQSRMPDMISDRSSRSSGRNRAGSTRLVHSFRNTDTRYLRGHRSNFLRVGRSFRRSILLRAPLTHATTSRRHHRAAAQVVGHPPVGHRPGWSTACALRRDVPSHPLRHSDRKKAALRGC